MSASSNLDKWFILIAMLALAGCHSSSSDSSGQRPLLAAFNAVPDISQGTFLREEEVWSDLNYGGSTAFRDVDADQYDLNFDVRLPGDDTSACAGDIDLDDIKDDDECTRVGSVSINVVGDHEYIVAMFGRFENRHIEVYDKTIHEFDTEDTDEDGDPEDQNMEVQIFHWSEALGAVDVYLQPPGTHLSPTQVTATLETGDSFYGLIDEGTYVVTLSNVADPNATIFVAENVTLSKQTRVAFAILEPTATSTASVKLSRFRDQSGDLLERRPETRLRLSHVAGDVGNVDVFVQEDYSQPFLPDLANRQTSEYLAVDPAAVNNLQFDITPVGNPGVLLAREFTNLTGGTLSTYFLVNSPTGALDGLNVLDRFQRLAHYAELRLVNSVEMNLDYYVVPRGSNIFTSNPTETLSAGSSGSTHLMEPGEYDIVLARSGTDTHVFGPLSVQLDAGSFYTAVGVATTDTTRADVVLLDDFVD